MAYGKDSYELSEKNGEYSQRMISWLNKKEIASIISTGDEFMFLVHKQFDSSYEVRSSKLEQVRIKIPEMISPGVNQRVIDFAQIDLNGDGLGERMVVLSARDSNFHYHELQPSLNKFNRVSVMKNFASRAAMWPYVAVADSYNQIWLFCSFDMNVIKKLELPHGIKYARIEQVFITVELDLFVLVSHFREKEYELLMVDLDMPRGFIHFSEQTFSLKSLFRYSFGIVDNLSVLDMCIRSSSSKTEISLNKKLFAFILHSGKLFFWVQGSNKLELIDRTTSQKIRQLTQEDFIYFKDDQPESRKRKNHTSLNLIKVSMRFSSYLKSVLYHEIAPIGSFIHTFAYDYQANNMIVMYKIQNNKHSKKIIVYDLTKQKRIGVSWVTDPEIIGRMTA